jgi:hypothetical protein
MEQIDGIFERLALGVPAKGDLLFVRRELKRSSRPNSFVVGGRRVATDHGRYFQVGGRLRRRSGEVGQVTSRRTEVNTAAVAKAAA